MGKPEEYFSTLPSYFIICVLRDLPWPGVPAGHLPIDDPRRVVRIVTELQRLRTTEVCKVWTVTTVWRGNVILGNVQIFHFDRVNAMEQMPCLYMITFTFLRYKVHVQMYIFQIRNLMNIKSFTIYIKSTWRNFQQFLNNKMKNT